MTRNFLISIALVAAIATAGQAANPLGWAGGNLKEYEFGRDTNVKHQGDASAEIHASADNPQNAGALAQVLKADKYRGKRIRLSGFVKPEAVDRWGGLWLRVDTAEKVGVQYGNSKAAGATGTADFAGMTNASGLVRLWR